jgi:hypothetical protein
MTEVARHCHVTSEEPQNPASFAGKQDWIRESVADPHPGITRIIYEKFLKKEGVSAKHAVVAKQTAYPLNIVYYK